MDVWRGSITNEFPLPRTNSSWLPHNSLQYIRVYYKLTLISHYKLPIFVCGWHYPKCHVRVVMLFPSFRICSISNVKFRQSNPFVYTYRITINSINHLHIYNPDSTLYRIKTIFNKISLADMYMNVTQYLQNMQRAFVGARPQMWFRGPFCYEVLINRYSH